MSTNYDVREEPPFHSVVRTRNWVDYVVQPDGHGGKLWWALDAPGMPDPLTWEQLLTWRPLMMVCCGRDR